MELFSIRIQRTFQLVSTDIEEELQISLFFALTFVANNQQQLTLTSCFKYDSEYEIILER